MNKLLVLIELTSEYKEKTCSIELPLLYSSRNCSVVCAENWFCFSFGCWILMCSSLLPHQVAQNHKL